jgi:peptidoglycan/LPS O-acetylase OafA/YrhL
MASNQKTGEPSWKWRRATSLVTIAFCMFLVAYLMDNADTRLNETIASGALWLLGTVVLIYSGLATAQDIAAILATRSGRPYADVVQSAPPPMPDQTVVVAQTNVQPQPTDPNKPPPGFAE